MAEVSKERVMMRSLLVLCLMLLASTAYGEDCSSLSSVDERIACQLEKHCPDAETDAEISACYERIIRSQLSSPQQERGASRDSGDAEAEFGLADRGRHPSTPQVSQVRSSITAMQASSHRRLLFLLENGQLWEQAEAQRVNYRVGDRVTVRRATFGSFRMVNDRNNRITTVRRVDCDGERNRAVEARCSAMGL